MSISAETIVAEALRLAPETRAFLAERLLESLDVESGTEISDPWRLEIAGRCREIDEGAVELREASGVFARAYDAIG